MTYLQSNSTAVDNELRGVLSTRHTNAIPDASNIDLDNISIDARSSDEKTAIVRARSLSSAANPTQQSNRRTLNTFTGVFCPVTLSQFSTLLFLRLGFVVGQSGILETTAMIFLGFFILFMTILSICAISTNGAVEGGGVYYMLSRTLGPEFGGAIGLLFYLANIFACALYVSAFVEGLTDNFGPGGKIVSFLPGITTWWIYLYCTIVLIFCLLVCLVGGSLFAKASLFILLVTLVCIGSVIVSCLFHPAMDVAIPRNNPIAYRHVNDTGNDTTVYERFTGMSIETFARNEFNRYKRDYTQGLGSSKMDFIHVFAVLFSSITGIMNGANLSGELKNPSRSIPLGTLSATSFTMLIYIFVAYLVAASCSKELMVNNNNFLQPINYWPPFIAIGVFATTLVAALGNLIGASRILEALANDDIFWIFLRPAKFTTKGGNPLVAVLISYFLVQLVLLVGSLNKIAAAVTVFFLLSYASTNLACMALDMASPSNFRPNFKAFHWQTALIGLIGCLMMSFLINAIYASVAIMALLLLVIGLHYRDLPDSWGSISQALIFHQVRKYLLKLDVRKSHVKYWRPQILLMVSNAYGNASLVEFVNDLKKGGLYVLGHVYRADFDELHTDPVDRDSNSWLSFVDHLHIKAFVELTVAKTVREGLRHLIWLAGLGGMKPNLVCLGFYDDEEPRNTLEHIRQRRGMRNPDEEDFILQGPRTLDSDRGVSRQEYSLMLLDVLKMQKDLLVCRHFHHLARPTSRRQKLTIDVWPVNFFQPEMATFFDATCFLMLQLACILHRVPAWKWRTTLRVFLCADQRNDHVQLQKKLDSLLSQLRIQADTHVINWEHVLEEHVPSVAAASAPHPAQNLMDEEDPVSMSVFGELSHGYVEAVNQLLRVQCPATAVTFLYMPRPPSDPQRHGVYLDEMERLTRGLPPTILVHGQHSVITANL